jgi:hypothetical protein
MEEKMKDVKDMTVAELKSLNLTLELFGVKPFPLPTMAPRNAPITGYERRPNRRTRIIALLIKEIEE